MPHVQGEDHPLHKLTAGAVAEIRGCYLPGHITMAELAELYDVSIQTISRILSGHTWAHLVEP